jgi:hypothetical protein
MGTYGGPNIITDELVVHLDAANPKSYPSTGTTWYDLSGNNNDFTMSGTPTYSNGEFTINNNGFYRTTIPTTQTSTTFVIFYKTTDTQELWVKGQSGSQYIAASINGGNYYDSQSGDPTYHIDTNTEVNPSSYKDGKYHMWEAKDVDLSLWTTMRFFLYGGDWSLIGTVAKILVYNKNLTSDESLQNYNALKSRFV